MKAMSRPPYLLLIFLVLILSGCAVTPKPFTSKEVDERVDKDLREMFENQEPIDRPITLYEAMARAIKYNLDHRLKLMEDLLAANQLEVSRYDLLPRLSGNAAYNRRNNEQGSSSIALTGPNAGKESLVTSTSREKDSRTANIDIVWNVLDFGVSYIRAKQQADQVLIIRERRRKVIQNILQEVRYAYWRAASAEHLINDMLELLEKSKAALEKSRQIEGQRLKTPRSSLEYQKALLENIRLLWSLIQKIKPAKSELASLININPGTSFKIAQPDWNNVDLPLFNVPVETLERMAMVNRPEIRENDYKHRISSLEIRKSFLNMLPGIELNFGYSYDSNKYMYNNNWLEAGTSVAWNIFDGLLSGPSNVKAAKSQVEVDTVSRRALSMAILAQVHLAYQRYHIIKEEYAVSKQLNVINRQLQAHARAEKSAGSVHEMTLIHDATNALLARMRDHMGYADLQNAAGKIYSTLGVDILPEEVDSLDIGTLSGELENAFGEQKKHFQSLATTETDNHIYSLGKDDVRAVHELPESSSDIKKEVLSDKMIAVDPVVTEVKELSVKDEQEGGPDPVKPGKEIPEPEKRHNGMVTSDRVNIRKGPSRKYGILCRVVNKGTVIELAGEREQGWIKVKMNDSEGWIYGRYLKEI